MTKKAESGFGSGSQRYPGAEPDPDPKVSGMDPHIRVQTKMSRIHNTAWNLATSKITVSEKKGTLIKTLFLMYVVRALVIVTEKK